MRIIRSIIDPCRATRGARNILLVSLLAFACSALTGCTGEQYQNPPASEPLCLVGATQAQVVAAAEQVLSTMRFALEKVDPETGLVLTRPLSGAQFFELWRDDNVGAFNSAEANLHTIRRTAELQVDKTAGGRLCVACRVRTERLEIPEQEAVTSSGRAYFLFSNSGQSLQNIELNPEQMANRSWTNLGRDALLEKRILDRIQKQLERSLQTVDNSSEKAGPQS